jgi:hypothetical protein
MKELKLQKLTEPRLAEVERLYYCWAGTVGWWQKSQKILEGWVSLDSGLLACDNMLTI